MAVYLQDGLRLHEREVIQTCDTPTVSTDHRWYGRVGAISLVREACPNTLVHRVEQIGAVHEREGGNVGQVDLDQFRVNFLQLGSVGFSGNLLDQRIDLRIAVLTPVSIPVDRLPDEF
jgi:hypothetical protein